MIVGYDIRSRALGFVEESMEVNRFLLQESGSNKMSAKRDIA